MAASLEITEPKSQQELAAIYNLFVEYWDWLQFDPCFQGFEEELRTLPGRYAPPSGCLLLARFGGKAIGCVALRQIDDEICEMKRLYVTAGNRGKKIGLELVKRVIREGVARGYARMRLDTLPVMANAVALYESLGFRDIEPYGDDPTPGARHMELDLRARRET
jgi:ribosomal protein S18 acetylase RimI-like enzyme